MSQQGGNSFLDRGTITALLIAMTFWMVWSWYMDKNYPQPKPQTATEAANKTEDKSAAVTDAQNTPAPSAEKGAAVAVSTEETLTDFDSENLAFKISSKGMGLKHINVKAFTTRTEEPIILGQVTEKLPFATALAVTDQVIDFQVTKSSDDTFVGRAAINGMNIEKTMKIQSHSNSVDVQIKVTGTTPEFKGLNTYINDKLLETKSSGFLSHSYEIQDFTILHEGSRSNHVVHPEKAVEVVEKNVSLVALGSHYFAMALVDKSPIAPDFTLKLGEKSPIALGVVTHAPVNPGTEFSVIYKAFAGPKSFSVLESADPTLTAVINFGMFSAIAKPLLWLLKWFNTVFHNYGWSIVVLTIIVRFVVLPFNLYSFRSMKVMQKLQPEMQRLRERYKEDPQTMNREVMNLMKENKANPIGGCLPMLLQLPVFFALYQVLGQSIELYKAPFILWIHDLSVHDPYYVLPALMGVTMFIQQRITPTTMDPAQAKILMWMPVIFTFFMISLPSGLTLYIFISTLFGIVQQFIFTREKSPEARVSSAQA